MIVIVDEYYIYHNWIELTSLSFSACHQWIPVLDE